MSIIDTNFNYIEEQLFDLFYKIYDEPDLYFDWVYARENDLENVELDDLDETEVEKIIKEMDEDRKDVFCSLYDAIKRIGIDLEYIEEK